AKEAHFEFHFKAVGNATAMHPNTIKLAMEKEGKTIEVIGESLGGGVINISEINGFTANFSARLHTLIITAEDKKGSIAFIADVVSHDNCNIATMSVSRKGKNDLACLVLEMDSGLKPLTREYLKSLNWVEELIYIPDIDL
ncbi:MAG: L-serine ammonia-lyase, iron-sulfur-dependent, subunit beta, partial [Bacteroidota bacterium]|nr:L-serine ammonia-lyase, iron-sulfur-dependent, subunit beta [Bacteroidota bacterium]